MNARRGSLCGDTGRRLRSATRSRCPSWPSALPLPAGVSGVALSGGAGSEFRSLTGAEFLLNYPHRGFAPRPPMCYSL